MTRKVLLASAYRGRVSFMMPFDYLAPWAFYLSDGIRLSRYCTARAMIVMTEACPIDVPNARLKMLFRAKTVF
jgi:hypothetical protein